MPRHALLKRPQFPDLYEDTGVSSRRKKLLEIVERVLSTSDALTDT